MNIKDLMPTMKIKTETGVITINDFSDFEDEIVSSYERGMGTESQHHLTGTVMDSQGNYYDVTIEVWEYPVGAINMEPTVISIEKQ